MKVNFVPKNRFRSVFFFFLKATIQTRKYQRRIWLQYDFQGCFYANILLWFPLFSSFLFIILNTSQKATGTSLSIPQTQLAASEVKVYLFHHINRSLIRHKMDLRWTLHVPHNSLPRLLWCNSPLIPTLLWCTVADAADSAQMRISVYVCSPQRWVNESTERVWKHTVWPPALFSAAARTHQPRGRTNTHLHRARIPRNVPMP